MSEARIVDEAEVAIVGGGPAGSSAAARLSELGHEVLLIDQSGFPRDKPCGDGVTHHAVAFLERKGLGHLVEDSHPIEDVRVVIGHDQERSGFYRPWPRPRTTPARCRAGRSTTGSSTLPGIRALGS